MSPRTKKLLLVLLLALPLAAWATSSVVGGSAPGCCGPDDSCPPCPACP